MEKRLFERIVTDLDSVINDIKNVASNIHDVDCNQKYGQFPYSYHLNCVADLAKSFGFAVCHYEHHILPIIFGAYFHDAIEDARLTYNDVLHYAEKFMTHYQAVIATEIVYALTDEKGRTRAERGSEKHYEDIRNTKYAPFVKWCDRFANMQFSVGSNSRMVNVYRSEMEDFVRKIGGNKYIPKELCDMICNL